MLVLLAFGFAFYKLAFNYDKNPWIWAVVGAATYVVSQLAISVLIGIFLGLGIMPEMGEWPLRLTIIAISSIIAYAVYYFFKKEMGQRRYSF